MSAAVAVLREVRLYGGLGRQFGRSFRLAVRTPAEAVQALCAVLDGFQRAFLGPDGKQAYHVFVGAGAARRDIGEADVAAPVGATEPIRIVPVVQGAKRQGTGQTILGYVLFVAGAFISVASYGSLAGVGNAVSAVGLQMMLGGVIQMISPQRTGRDNKVDNAPSYAFDGPVNNTEQGGPVPLAYGRVITGSTVVSQGLSTSDLLVPGAYGDGSSIDPPLPTVPVYEETGP